MNRKASAVWQGSGKDGKGQLTTQSGVLSDNPYGFNTRFENEPGTNPEELIAAAMRAASPWRWPSSSRAPASPPTSCVPNRW